MTLARRVATLAAAVALAVAVPAGATSVVRLPLARVAGGAARIVHATVVDVRAGRDDDGLPATWVTLDVVQTLKGRADGRVVFKQYGVTDPRQQYAAILADRARAAGPEPYPKHHHEELVPFPA